MCNRRPYVLKCWLSLHHSLLSHHHKIDICQEAVSSIAGTQTKYFSPSVCVCVCARTRACLHKNKLHTGKAASHPISQRGHQSDLAMVETQYSSIQMQTRVLFPHVPAFRGFEGITREAPCNALSNAFPLPVRSYATSMHSFLSFSPEGRGNKRLLSHWGVEGVEELIFL